METELKVPGPTKDQTQRDADNHRESEENVTFLHSKRLK